MKKSSLMVRYTNKCNAQCRHCCVEAGPQRNEKLPPELIKPVLPEFYDYGIREICFSGGEPLLFIDELEGISGEIKRIGFRQTVRTNAFWADSFARAKKYALRLKSMGVEEVILSTSRFHIEYIDFTNIRIAAEALIEAGITVTIGLNHDKEKNIDNASLLFNVMRLNIPYTVQYLCSVGRATLLTNETVFDKKPSGAILNKPCPRQSQIVVDANGDVQVCCPPSLEQLETDDFFLLGNIKHGRLDEMYAKYYKNEDLLRILRHEGPGGIYRLMENSLLKGKYALKDSYDNPCELCMDLLGNKSILMSIRESVSLKAKC